VIRPRRSAAPLSSLLLSPVGETTLSRLWRELDEDLASLQQQNLLRTLTTLQAIRGTQGRIKGRRVTLWCTNDYLGLSQHPRLIRAACQAARRWGIGARASRLLAGSTALHEQLEQALATFFRAKAAAVFASGYLANVGALGALAAPEDLILIDRLAHASLIDACRLTRAQLRVFHHNDAAHAEAVLRRGTRARRRFIVTEGVFSMDGDRAPLRALLDVAQRHEALVYVDDAHGAFVAGATGRGSPEHAGVPHASLLYMGTLGKALGCQGGFVIGPRSLIATIHNRARTFIYATALATPIAAAALEGLRVVREEPALRQRLAGHAQRLWNELREFTSLPAEPSHILPVMVGSTAGAQRFAMRLWQRGHFAPAIRPPTVPKGTARLRISLSAAHTPQQLQHLSHSLQQGLAA